MSKNATTTQLLKNGLSALFGVDAIENDGTVKVHTKTITYDHVSGLEKLLDGVDASLEIKRSGTGMTVMIHS